jgi:predicted transcriptional regulator
MATSVKLDPNLKDRVQHLAETRQRSAHWIMREAIREYVEREEKREDFDRETRESWVEFQETGLHLTLAEVDAWLQTWGTDAETDPPECHK